MDGLYGGQRIASEHLGQVFMYIEVVVNNDFSANIMQAWRYELIGI